MKRCYRTVFTALSLMAAAAGGARAADNNYIPVPDYGTVSLPEISTGTPLGKALTACVLRVEIVDAAGKQLEKNPPQMAEWKNGVWKNVNRAAVAQLLFSVKEVKDLPLKLRYKLEYHIDYKAGSALKNLTLTEYLPAERAQEFAAAAAFPLELVTVDARALKWADSDAAAASGVRAVRWTITRKLGTAAGKETGTIMPKGPLTAYILVNKDGALAADIFFHCKGGRQVPWADSGKDLRKLAPGLEVRLSQPACQ